MNKSNMRQAVTFRGIVSLLFLIASGISIYLIFYSEGDMFWPILLSVYTALTLFNCGVILYSMQPVSPFKKGPYVDMQDDWYPVLSLIYIVFYFIAFIIFLLPQILFERNSYRPAQLFILAGTIAVVTALISVTYQSLKAAYVKPIDSLRYE